MRQEKSDIESEKERERERQSFELTCTATHHDRIVEDVLADRAYQLLGNLDLDDNNYQFLFS